VAFEVEDLSGTVKALRDNGVAFEDYGLRAARASTASSSYTAKEEPGSRTRKAT
jgi:hypothetical protein